MNPTLFKKTQKSSSKQDLKQYAQKLFQTPFMDLLFQAQKIHRKFHPHNTLQLSSLINIKSGSCPEDCSYCPQSSRYHTKIDRYSLLKPQQVHTLALKAKKQGSHRLCLGAAWKSPPHSAFPILKKMIQILKNLHLQSCMTLGSLTQNQALFLANSGLDYYNHNIDTSQNYYEKIITTRKYQDRLDTLKYVQKAGIKVCSGGIVGMGESQIDRVEFLLTLAQLNPQPQSVPINLFVPIPGTPLAQKLQNQPSINSFDWIKTIAAARILMPHSSIRLSAGRLQLNPEAQTLAFLAGANSIFYGNTLLTSQNPQIASDQNLFQKLDIQTKPPKSLHS